MKTTEQLITDLAKLKMELAHWTKHINFLQQDIAETEKAVEDSKYKPINHELTEFEWERYINGLYMPVWNSKIGPIKATDLSENHLLNLLLYALKRKMYKWSAVIVQRLMLINRTK